MAVLLQVKASIFGEQGISTGLGNHYVELWKQANPDGEVRVHDLFQEPVPHLDLTRLGAMMTPATERSPDQAELASMSDALIQDWRDADVVALGAPMYNLGIPSGLKAYFDLLMRARVTFRYTPTGVEGLLADRPVYVFATRGGAYVGTAMDNHTPAIRQLLNFIGISSVEFVYAERVNMGEEQKAAAIAAARQQISQKFS